MKAVIYTKYGEPDVLKLADVAQPTPKDHEVLIRIRATTVTLFDCWMRSATAPPGFWLPNRIDVGIRKPKQPILGTEFSGEIESVGAAVTRFKQGDAVFGFSGKLGAYAEYICMPQDAVAAKPSNMSFAEAAAVPQGALTALYFLRKANAQSGQKVLILGASGGVGNYAVQLAKAFGAEVTGVCSSPKMAWVKSLGADQVMDYTCEDFSRNGQTYDIILDTIGKSPVSRSLSLLSNKGHYVLVTFGLFKLLQALVLSKRSSKHLVIGILEEKSEDLLFLKALIEAGTLRAVIDRCYDLEQIADAHQHVESGQKAGNVVITMM